MAEAAENPEIEEEEEEVSEMPARWCACMDGNLCRYGYSADGVLRAYSVICRI